MVHLGHKNLRSLKKISKSGRVLVMPQGEISKYVQANDRWINLKIQKKLEQLQTKWLMEKILNLHNSGDPDKAIPNPTISEVALWLQQSVASLTSNDIRKSFEEVGLTISVDGSEDDKLHSG